MVFVVVLVASLLVVAESQVSDTMARAKVQGFLSKYIDAYSSGAHASNSPFGNYNKFFSPSFPTLSPQIFQRPKARQREADEAKARADGDHLSHHKYDFKHGEVANS